MAILRNMAAMLSTTTGTGTLTLTTAASGFNTFANANVANASTVTYLIIDGATREAGRGVYTTSGLTLTRATVLSSTNGGSTISCSGGQTVYITDAAEDHIWIDEAQVPAFTAAQKTKLFSNIGGAPFGGQLTAPVLTEFTELNKGSNVISQNNNSITIQMPTTNATRNFTGIYKASPSTPYRVQALIKPGMIWSTNGFGAIHLGWYDGTKLQFVQYSLNSKAPQLITASWSTVTASNTTHGTGIDISMVDLIWLAVSDDATTVYFRYSFDGVNWITQYSIAKSSGYLGSTGYSNVVFGVTSYFNSTAFFNSGTLLSWDIAAAAP